jgi:hypothetical protein
LPFREGYGQAEYEAERVNESVVTFGSLCNFHTYFYNVQPYANGYDDSITPRASSSPGIGAYSYHSGYLFRATRDIEAGEEIFANYGPNWLKDRGLHFPNENDFDAAGEIILKALNGLSDTNELNDGVLSTLKNVVEYFSSDVASLIPDNTSNFESVTRKVQMHKDRPSSFVENNDEESESIARSLALESISVRTLDWIKNEGQCLDNLVPQISTLPHAGRGAFAQRSIAKGQVVVPAPLLLCTDKEDLNMYQTNEEDADHVKTKIGTQLMINYCFSHPLSSMLLCPQTNAILLNHCSTRKSYGGDCEKYNSNEDPNLRGANAELRWATTWDPDTTSWLQKSYSEISDLVEQKKRGLSLEIVATRDIHPGEEVFIDYGEEWEAAWDQHVQGFTLSPQDKDHVTTVERNKLVYLKTREELEDDPLSKKFELTCIYWMEEGEEADSGLRYDAEEWISDGSMYVEESEYYHSSGWEWPCEVIARNDTDNSYTVEIFERILPTLWGAHGMSRILKNYPRSSMHYMPAEYSSDQHLEGAFRKFIGIPDDLFPNQWKNLVSHPDLLHEKIKDEL